MPGGLDHLAHAVRDLDAAAELYRRLGFTVGARNRHAWGTHNRLVQTPSFFVELLTVAEPEKLGSDGFSALFGTFNRLFLKDQEGLSLLILESSDAAADAARFRSAGIGASDAMPSSARANGRTARPSRSGSRLRLRVMPRRRRSALPFVSNTFRKISGIRRSNSIPIRSAASRPRWWSPKTRATMRRFCRPSPACARTLGARAALPRRHRAVRSAWWILLHFAAGSRSSRPMFPAARASPPRNFAFAIARR
jgi:catechol 2,3-dioxygenase-like lactoylglutathione lyase family enzyme